MMDLGKALCAVCVAIGLVPEGTEAEDEIELVKVLFRTPQVSSRNWTIINGNIVLKFDDSKHAIVCILDRNANILKLSAYGSNILNHWESFLDIQWDTKSGSISSEYTREDFEDLKYTDMAQEKINKIFELCPELENSYKQKRSFEALFK